MKLNHKLTMMTADAEITFEHMESEYKGKAIVLFVGNAVPPSQWKEYEMLSVSDDERKMLAEAGYSS